VCRARLGPRHADSRKQVLHAAYGTVHAEPSLMQSASLAIHGAVSKPHPSGPPPCRRQASPAVSRRASKGSPVRIASIVKSVLAYPCEPFAYGQIVRAHPSLPYPVSWRLTCTSDTQSARHGLRCRPPDRCICQGVRCHCPGGTRLPSVALFFASCVASCFIPVNLPGRKNAPIEERFLSHVGHVH